MILENSLKRGGFGYAQLILAAYHADEGYFSGHSDVAKSFVRVCPLWGYAVGAVREELVGGAWEPERNFASDGYVFDRLFPGLRERMFAGKLNHDYNALAEDLHEQELWMVQANGADLLAIWRGWFKGLADGPQGADDDTFDYWPSAWGVMLHMAEDLIELGVADEAILREAQQAWDTIAASRGEGDIEYMEQEIVPRPVLPSEVKATTVKE